MSAAVELCNQLQHGFGVVSYLGEPPCSIGDDNIQLSVWVEVIADAT